MNTTSERLEGLEISYDNNASASFLVLKSASSKQLLGYQLQMISSNKINHVIAPEMKRNDGNLYFYYNITSRLPLATFLKRRKLSRNEFVRILSDIAGVVLNSSGYLLSDTGFVLDADYMYINPFTMDIQLVYIPLEQDCDMAECFKDFVSRLVLNHAEFEESISDNFLQRILNFTKSELFNIPDFYLFLNRLSNSEGIAASHKAAHTDDDLGTVGAPDNAPAEAFGGNIAAGANIADKSVKYFGKNEVYKQNSKAGVPLKDTNDKRNDVKISRAKAGARQGGAGQDVTKQGGAEQDVAKQAGAKQDVAKRAAARQDAAGKGLAKLQDTRRLSIPLLVLALSLQAVIAAAFILAGRYLKQVGNGSTTTFAALIMIALAIDVLMLRKLVSLGLISATAVKDKKPAKDNPGKAVVSGYDALTACCTEQPDGERSNQEYNAEYYSSALNNGSCNTVLLSQSRREYPCLLDRFGDGMEEIILNKPEYVIGRLEGQVDHVVVNSAVGKVHACITTRDEGCFLTDYNSVNGTYINNVRIDSNKEYEMKDNDIIAFANSRYVFLKP